MSFIIVSSPRPSGRRVSIDLEKFLSDPTPKRTLLRFSPTRSLQGNISTDVTGEFCHYPIGRWRGGQQKIDHMELSGHLDFQKVFVSRVVSPGLQHQTLRNEHPFIILCINMAERMDMRVIMCRSLEWHVTTTKQIMFPAIITALCELAGVQAREDDRFIRSGTTLGAIVYNNIAR